ncbi:MAG: thioredoxin family protein [bacterium]
MVKKLVLGFVLVPLVFLTVGLKQSAFKGVEIPKKKKADKIVWTTFDKGIELAKKENKLLVVDFFTDWCYWCKVMDKETYANKEVIKFAKENVIMAKLNAETNEKFKFKDKYYSGRELTMMFGVRGFPTTVFMNSKSELITSVSGYIPADKFMMILKYLADHWYEKMKFDEFVKKEKEQKNKS